MLTCKNLHITGKDFFYDGDVRLLGNTIIENANITVTGKLSISPIDEKDFSSFQVIGGDITAKEILIEGFSCFPFSVKDGNIFITDGNFVGNRTTIEEVCDIVVNGNLYCNDINSSYSIYVDGFISAYNITTLFDLFTNEINMTTLHCGRDFYAHCGCFHGSSIYVKGKFECETVEDIKSIKVG